MHFNPITAVDAIPIHKATIIPRGNALGMVTQVPDKDEYSISKSQLLARLDVAMGGRAAEHLVFGKENVTTGASSDFTQATKLAQAMITKYGMSDEIGTIMYTEEDIGNLSSDTKQKIEVAVSLLLKNSYERAMNILQTHRDELERLSGTLLEYETLSRDDIYLVLRDRYVPSQSIHPLNTDL